MSNKHKTPLLDRRGAEPDERSESDEVGWWIAYSQGLCHPERSEGSPPPRPLSRHLRRLARVHPSCPGGESCMEKNLHFNILTFNELQIRHYKTTTKYLQHETNSFITDLDFRKLFNISFFSSNDCNLQRKARQNFKRH